MKRIVFLICLSLSAATASADPCKLDKKLGITVEQGVEPEICAAFARVVARLPPAHQKQLDKLKLRRAPDLGVPGTAPLAYRILGRATLAYYSISPHALVVTDAGLANKAAWGPEKVSRADLVPFLFALADGLGVPAPQGEDDPGLVVAWRAFCAAIDKLAKRPPGPDLPLGDPRPFDDLVRLGVPELLGPGYDLDQLLAHELGHMLQLHPGIGASRIRAWAALSDWRHVPTGEPTDGFEGGGFHNEDAMVAVRLVLGMSRGKTAQYEPRADRFATGYARFDPMEDFAESFRMLLYRREALAQFPDKLIAVNAAGDALVVPHDPAWAAALDAGARRIYGYTPGPRVNPYHATAWLKPWAKWLGPTAKAVAAAAPVLPDDLPKEAADHLKGLVVNTPAGPLRPHADLLFDEARHAVEQLETYAEFDRGLLGLGTVRDAKEVEKYGLAKALGWARAEKSPAGRAAALAQLARLLPDGADKKKLAIEAGKAARAVPGVEGVLGLVGVEPAAAVFAEAEKRAAAMKPGYVRAKAYAALAHAQVAAGDDAATATAAKITGQSTGALARANVLMEICQKRMDAGDHVAATAASKAAAAAQAQIVFTEWRGKVRPCVRKP